MCNLGVTECDSASATAHHGRGGCGLVHLVLSSLNFGLQVGWRMEVLAFFPRAPTLDVVHAHGDCVVIGVYHGAICRVGKATVVFPSRAITSLILSTHLKTKDGKHHLKPILQSDKVDLQKTMEFLQHLYKCIHARTINGCVKKFNKV